MVRPCQAELGIQDALNALIQKRVQAEVGIVIGMPAVGSRDVLLCIARTPAQDGVEAAQLTSTGQAGGKGKARGSQVSLSIDEDWMVSHADQVQRMLPGGLQVMGAYVVTPEPGYQAAASQLSSVLNSILPAGAQARRSDSALLLHVDPITSRTTLRACAAGCAGPTSLKPCELKYGSALTSLVCLATSLAVDMSLPLAAGSKQQLHQQAAAVVDAQCSRIQSAQALVQGELLLESAALADVIPKATAGDSSTPAMLQAQMLLQLPCQPHPAAAPPPSQLCQQQQVGGCCRLQGCIAGVAVAHVRQPASRAAEALRADLQGSLRARLELLLEEAEQLEQQRQEEQQQQQQAQQGQQGQQQQQASHPLLAACGGKLYTSALPRRVLLPWMGHLRLSDHLLAGEQAADSLERCRAMLGLQLQEGGQVEEAEAAAAGQGQAGFWDPNQVAGEAQRCCRAASRPTGPPAACTPALLAGAGAAAALAAAMSYMVLYS